MARYKRAIMSRLEIAALHVHFAFGRRVGTTADYPIRLIADDQQVRSVAISALHELDDAIFELQQRMECEQSRAYHK